MNGAGGVVVRYAGPGRDRAAARQVVWNVGSGMPTAVRELAEATAELMDADPELLGFGDIARREDDVPWLVGSRETIERELDWRPALDLRAGLRRALDSEGGG